MKKKAHRTPRKRLFTAEYKLGDRVYIIREEHGWHNGSTQGNITHMTDMGCTVTTDEGIPYFINHPRDINKVR